MNTSLSTKSKARYNVAHTQRNTHSLHIGQSQKKKDNDGRTEKAEEKNLQKVPGQVGPGGGTYVAENNPHSQPKLH